MESIVVTGLGFAKENDRNTSLDSSGFVKEVRAVLDSEKIALSASKKTIFDANLINLLPSERVGIVLEVEEGIDKAKADFFGDLIDEGPEFVSPLLFPYTSPNAVTSQLAIAFGLKGECVTLANGKSSVWKMLSYAVDLLRLRKLESVVTGEVLESSARFLVLETKKFAKGRDARIYGEVKGLGDRISIDPEQGFNQEIYKDFFSSE